MRKFVLELDHLNLIENILLIIMKVLNNDALIQEFK